MILLLKYNNFNFETHIRILKNKVNLLQYKTADQLFRVAKCFIFYFAFGFTENIVDIMHLIGS